MQAVALNARAPLLLFVLVSTMSMLATDARAQGFSFERLVMPGPVIQAHASVENSCASCHRVEGGEGETALCGACHVDVQRDRLDGRGFHGRDPVAVTSACSNCHQEHEGRNGRITVLDVASFDHELTDFPLHDSHVGVECASCHAADTKFSQASSTCIGCHTADDVHMGTLGSACSNCHSETSWANVEFDHGMTQFPLTGAHVEAQCTSCHRSQTFVGAPLQCSVCHARDDVHQGRNGTNCASCHSDLAWNPPSFDHTAISGFALTGAHRTTACQSCHTVDFETSLVRTCVGCHSDDDPHRGSLGESCGSCHNSLAWATNEFDHVGASGFALNGAHADAECTACHRTGTAVGVAARPGTMTPLPVECAGCHTEDPHLGQLGTACATCHFETAWTGRVLFDHDLTHFPLVGTHATTSCAECHASPAFHDANDACVDCHATDDVHAGGFGTACATCHNPTSWQAWMFDHDVVAGFPLTGAHESLGCAACHGSSLDDLAGAAANCAQCHRNDDPHDGRFGGSCGDCHTTEEF